MAGKNWKKLGLTAAGALAGSFGALSVLGRAARLRDEREMDRDNPYEPVDLPAAEGIYQRVVKRAADKVLAFGGLVLLSPLYAAISLAIYADDPGPVLFSQKRVGKGKHFFRLHKFRSMRMDTPHDVPTHLLSDPEQYITRVGRFLRRSSLDELPQIWDIFVGSMSVIGPRPALWNQADLVAERDKYGANDVTPGLTGWAQINGRDELEIPEKARLDGEYVAALRRGGLAAAAFDAKCFLGTIHSVAEAEGVVEGGTGEMKKHQQERPLSGVNLTAESAFAVPPAAARRVLVLGKTGYIASHLGAELAPEGEDWTVTNLGMRGGEWESADFSGYDAVIFAAGIAHRKETEENAELYYTVNRDLAVRAAEKAREAGVRQFVYLSSMAVYGLDVSSVPLTIYTPAAPVTHYGKSKLQAEKALRALETESFHVTLIRAPMVYGEGAPGNLERLYAAVRKVHAFPTLRNQRSALHIDNLCAGVREILKKGYTGVVLLQDGAYRCTAEAVREEMTREGVKVCFTPAFDGAIRAMIGRVGLVSKAFGDLVYEQNPQNGLAAPAAEPHTRISLLTVVFNGEKTLPRTMESVLRQSYAPYEYIILDGASSDGTAELARSWAERFAKRGIRFTVISEPDKGMYDALNKGVAMAAGEVIGQINADDWLEPDALRHVAETFERTEFDYFWGDLKVLTPGGSRVKIARVDTFPTSRHWNHPTMYFKASVAKSHPYRLHSMYDDFELYLRLRKEGLKAVTLNRVISNFTFGGMSTQKDFGQAMKRARARWDCYRMNGYGFWYLPECYGMEIGKYLLS